MQQYIKKKDFLIFKKPKRNYCLHSRCCLAKVLEFILLYISTGEVTGSPRYLLAFDL